MSKPKKFWIKERHNPQLGVYYIAMGEISSKRAREAERNSIYGYNYMHGYETEAEYNAELQRLKDAGESVL